MHPAQSVEHFQHQQHPLQLCCAVLLLVLQPLQLSAGRVAQPAVLWLLLALLHSQMTGVLLQDWQHCCPVQQ